MIILPVLIIIGLLSYYFLWFRAYACFNLIMIGLGMFIAGCAAKENIFRIPGLLMLITGIAILFVTSLKVEKSMRPTYMVRVFLYGMALFLRLILIMMIIGIPFAALFSAMAANYREMIIVDCYGRDTGQRVIVDENSLKGPDGTQYDRYNPY